jgi:hypothetical protein
MCTSVVKQLAKWPKAAREASMSQETARTIQRRLACPSDRNSLENALFIFISAIG